MKLTRSVSYAVGILLRVQSSKSGAPMTATAIAEGCDFPPRFLYRVLRRMVDAGLINGISGPGGGYSLAKPAKDISMLDVVNAVEGPLVATELEPVNSKQKKSIAAINTLCAENAAVFSQELSKLNLLKLATNGK